MRSKVSSDWLASYIEATRTVLEIFKMAGYFPYSPCTACNYTLLYIITGEEALVLYFI
jgi:hypothetical protein